MHRACHFADSVQNAFHVKGRAPKFGFEIREVSFVEHTRFRLEFVKIVALGKRINDFRRERFGTFALHKHFSNFIITNGNLEGFGLEVVKVLDVQFRVKRR